MATLTLEPNGVGDETAIPNLVGAATHWQAVLTDDGNTSYVGHPGGVDENWYRDLYAIENSAGLGAISSIKIRALQYFLLNKDGYTSGTLRFSLKTHGTVYDVDSLGDSYNYTWRENTWDTNPYTGNPWTWDEINALQAGISLHRTHSFVPGGRPEVRCTQVYVAVTYGPPVAPTVTTDPATSVESASATLNGTLNQDGGVACACGFEWGETIAYGNTTPTQSRTTGQTFAQGISGLDQGKTYHFRAFATNSGGISYGADRTFTTELVISRAFALAREEL